jgi:hypothetical protein
MSQTLLLIVGMIGGLCFACLATYLNVVRADALRAVERTKAEAPEEIPALLIQITDKFKITTGAPIVALYILAVIVAVGPVSWFLYLQAKAPPRYDITGYFSGYRADKPICLEPSNLVDNSGSFTLPMWYSSDDPNPRFASTVGDYEPITIGATIDSKDQQVFVTITNFQGRSNIRASLNPATREITLASPIPLVYSPPKPLRTSLPTSSPRPVPAQIEPSSNPSLLTVKDTPKP